MKYGYVKGTAEQVESQIRALLPAGVQTAFCDFGQPSREDRRGYQSLLNTVKRGDTFVVTDCSRLTRDCLTVLALEDQGVTVDTLTENLRGFGTCLKVSVTSSLKEVLYNDDEY